MGHILGRSKKALKYHGRTGHPCIHQDARGKFIMVRRRKKEGGGTKRLYLTKSGNVPLRSRTAIQHRR